ncbi:Transcriptional regulator OS=Streptomyces microflavus OX=1919 GN=Smic_07970 PE=4 SV=1 [Streptomyces microflavus]
MPVGRRVRYELAKPKLAHALAELAELVLLVDHQGQPDRACAADGACCAGGTAPGRIKNAEASRG